MGSYIGIVICFMAVVHDRPWSWDVLGTAFQHHQQWSCKGALLGAAGRRYVRDPATRRENFVAVSLHWGRQAQGGRQARQAAHWIGPGPTLRHHACGAELSPTEASMMKELLSWKLSCAELRSVVLFKPHPQHFRRTINLRSEWSWRLASYLPRIFKGCSC